MPELPDVEMLRRYLEAEALGRRIADVEVRDKRTLRELSPSELAEAVDGKPMTATGRRGKWLFARVGRAPWLVMHMRMTGTLRVTERGEPLPPFTRVTFHFADGGALHFCDQRRFGIIGLTSDPDVLAYTHHLGPDALDPRLSASAFGDRLAKRRGSVKTLLLDQSLVAGVGNIYGDEICLAAGISPLSRVEDLSAEERQSLYRAMRSVLTTAVQRMAEGRSFPRGWIIAERHEGGVCPRCGEPVSRVRLRGRYSYWCPCVQRVV